MKPRFLILALVVAALARAQEPQPQNIDTLRGERYEKAVVTSTPATITVMHQYGVATIPFAELLEDVRNRYHDDPQKAQAWLQAVAQTQRREYEAQAEAQRKQAKAQYDAEYEAGRRHAQAAEDTIALGHFVESGAHLVYNPATKKVYFSDAEAAAAREAALRAALSVGERH